jgi:hypothetical protein
VFEILLNPPGSLVFPTYFVIHSIIYILLHTFLYHQFPPKMDAVNKVVNAATAALWGDGSTVQQQTTPHGEEPIAGVQGKGNFNDPFDAGNREGKSKISTSTSTPRP